MIGTINDKAIEDMKNDIINTNILFNDEVSNILDKYKYYISVYVSDNTSLIKVCKLFKLSRLISRSITMIPKTYKSCKFDCFSISEILNEICNKEDYNIDTISIIESDDVNEGDFYISIIRENKETNLIDIYTYKSLNSYK